MRLARTADRTVRERHAVALRRHPMPPSWHGGPDELPLRDWLGEAARHHARPADHVPPAHRQTVRRFLAAEPPAADHEPVFSHNDLGIEHVLVDPSTWRVTGVLDRTDAAIVGPAFDFDTLRRVLGPTALHTALQHYPRGDAGGSADIAERAEFSAGCTVFEDLAHGMATNQPAYVATCRTSLSWLSRLTRTSHPTRPTLVARTTHLVGTIGHQRWC